MGWALLTYNLPTGPSRHRVRVWRLLRKSGAVNFQQSLWVLPDQEEALKLFRDLAADIEGLGGQATVLRVVSLAQKDEGNILRAFREARDLEFKEFIDKCHDFFAEIQKETSAGNFTFAEVEENEEELDKLKGWLEKVQRRDFSGSELREEAGRLLSQCESLLSEFCERAHAVENKARGDVQ